MANNSCQRLILMKVRKVTKLALLVYYYRHINNCGLQFICLYLLIASHSKSLTVYDIVLI